ncbi:MAG: hypothetical protein KJO21_06970 [Verrucomicrobiae bacterium]|nr:hypothetical protein [Verrucomicrobiae bacterium]NNJ42496.1 hypothetical protein [Akkermansiaceae bacterium]
MPDLKRSEKMNLTFNSKYEFFCYLYDEKILTSFEVFSDAGRDLIIELTPDPPSEEIKDVVTSVIWHNFAHLTGYHVLKRTPDDGLVTQVSRSEELDLWDQVDTFSNEIMKIIGTHLALPVELFENSRGWEPSVFVNLKMSCLEGEVKSFSIECSDFDIEDCIDRHSLKISLEEVMGIIEDGSALGVADAIKDYVLGINVHDFESTGFDLTLDEYKIYHLYVYGCDQIHLKNMLGENDVLKIE